MADSDYDPTILDSITITIDQNTPAEGVCFNMPITPDSRVESDETFTISLDDNPGRITLNPTTRQASITIVNDDGKHLQYLSQAWLLSHFLPESYQRPTCLSLLAACPAPPELNNGDSALSGGPPSMAGATATYTCDSGYELAGDSVLTCQVGDVWSPATPGTCQGGSIIL